MVLFGLMLVVRDVHIIESLFSLFLLDSSEIILDFRFEFC